MFLPVSWSAKGKLLALGLASGDIEAFSPAAPSAVKAVVPKVQGLSEGTIISTSWLSNTEFYSVYTPPGPPSPDAEHTHYVTQFDPKTNLFAEVKVNPPALPFPGLRAPNQFVVLFRSWDTARILAFVGDSASSDIGALAAIGENYVADSLLDCALVSTRKTRLLSRLRLISEEDSSPELVLMLLLALCGVEVRSHLNCIIVS